MTTIYFILFAFVGITCEISNLFNPGQTLQRIVDLKTWSKRKEVDPSVKLPDGMALQVIYLLLSFIGLFTSQWAVFLILFILGLCIPKKWKVTIVIDAFLSLILVLAIVINKFHVHYDLTEYVISVFK